MDLFSLGFLLLILVASGFVAFVADRLGKKLGKKRLSIWGLRPKHVATLGTVVMGVLVSAITIALVAAASRDARVWLREGRQLLIQRDQLRKQNQSLQSERGRLMRDAEELGGANERLRKSVEDYRNKLSVQQKNLEDERARLARAQDQRKRLESEAARLQAEAARLRAETALLGTRVASLQRSLSATAKDLESNRKLLAQKQKALRTTQNALKSYQAQVLQARQDLQTSKTNTEVANENLKRALSKSNETYQKLVEVQAQVDAATSRIAELTKEREKAEFALEGAQKQYTATQSQLTQAQKELVDVLAQVQIQQGFLNSGYKTSRTERMTFRVREEIARFVVPGGADASTARSALTSLIRLARLEAADRGAKGGKSNGQTFEVADIFDRQDPKTGAGISSEELKSAVVTRVAGRVEAQVLIATSSLNAFAGEPVSLDISVLPNPVIYHQGEMLSEARIDGSLAEDRIFSQISDFVRSRVRERAVQDRMIPRSGTDAPFGEVPMSDMFALVGQIKRVGRSVRLQAIAGDDIHAADPLRLEFRLK